MLRITAVKRLSLRIDVAESQNIHIANIIIDTQRRQSSCTSHARRGKATDNGFTGGYGDRERQRAKRIGKLQWRLMS